MASGHALVVGGTGILAPAAATLAQRGDAVTVLARGARDAPPRRFAAAADASDPAAVAAALDGALAARGPFSLALVYAPFAAPVALEQIARRVAGRTVHLVGSEWVAPGADPRELDERAPAGAGTTQRVLLGWTTDETGATRWHTPEEVSRAAVRAAAADVAETTLGSLRPWSERPQ